MKITINGDSNDYVIDTQEITCTCPDFKFRRSYKAKSDPERLCKHLEWNKSILKGIDIRFPYSTALEYYQKLYPIIAKYKKIKKFEFCGSFRRLSTTVGDLDLLLSCDKQTFNFLCDKIQKEFNATQLWRGPLKTSYVLNNEIQLDLKRVPLESWHFATLHFTGPASENIRLRRKANQLGLVLNEYNLEGLDNVKVESEKDIYDLLGEDFKFPQDR